MENERLDRIEKQLELLTKQIKILTEATQEVHNSCGRMDSHIVLIEEAYDILRTPFNFITNQVNAITGNNDKKELPYREKVEAIENKSEKKEEK